MRNNRWKKITSGILAVCLIAVLLLSNQSFGVFAEEEDTQVVAQEETQPDPLAEDTAQNFTEETTQNVEAQPESDPTENTEPDTTADSDAFVDMIVEDEDTSGDASEEVDIVDPDEETDEEDVSAQSAEEEIDFQSEDTEISALIDADEALLKWKATKEGTVNISVGEQNYSVNDEDSFTTAYTAVCNSLKESAIKVTGSISGQTISGDTIWNISDDVELNGNVTVDSSARLVILGTGTISRSGAYKIINKGNLYLQESVYINGAAFDEILISMSSGTIYLTDEFHIGNCPNKTAIVTTGGTLEMSGGLVGTKDISIEWKDENDNVIGTKSYEESLNYIDSQINSNRYDYVSDITSTGGCNRGIQIGYGSQFNMSGGVVAGNIGGAGLYLGGTSVITDGLIFGNVAGVKDESGWGGAIADNGSTKIAGGRILANHATGYGGAINAGSNTIFEGNAVIAYNSALYNGGAVVVNGSRKVTLQGEATVTHNTAIGKDVNSNTGSGNGGAFRVVGTLEIAGGTISYNYANGRSETNPSYLNSGHGGAISSQTDSVGRVATIKLSNGEIRNNKARENGGAIWSACMANNLSLTFRLEGTAIKDNIAGKEGGGVYLAARSGNFTADILSGELSGNMAGENGGGMYLELGEVNGSLGKSITVNIGKQGDSDNNLLISNNVATQNGGALYVGRSANNTTDSNTIDVSFYSGTMKTNSAVNGGGISILKGALKLYGGTVSANTATSNGGGFYVADGAVRMFGGTITSNHADKTGGGFYVSSAEKAADVVVRSGSITNNTSGGSGAGIAVVGGDSAKADTVVLGLLEEHEGLTISEDNARSFTPFDYTDEIDNTSHTHASCPVLQGNIADGDGGGIYMQSSAANLNIYCLNENGNISKTNTNGNGVMMAGGNLVIGDEQNNNAANARGNTDISSPMLVEGGTVDIWGSMNNPLFEKDILVDIKSNAGKFEDHRVQAADKERYKIQYFENFTAGGTQNPSGMYIASQYNVEDSIDAVGTLFEHDGWRILGWATKADKDANKITYTIGANIGNKDNHDAWGNDHTQALVLYAIWDRSIYTVKFNPNANTYEGSMSNQTFSYALSQPLSSNQYKVTGKRFTGWNTKADGTGTDYAENYSESKMTLTNEATIELYAQWVDCTHKAGDHPGTLSYTVNTEANTITETCDCGGHTATIGLVGRNAYHDGKTHPAEKTISGSLLADNPTVKYKQCATQDGAYTDMADDTVPIDVGFYEASIIVGDKTISVRYQILSASSTVSVDAECIDGQRFGIFSGSKTCRGARDDAFTVLYSVRNLNDNYNATAPSLVLNQQLPAGTTIIMQTNGSYWYKNLDTETKSIALSDFTQMGGSAKFSYNFMVTQEYRFVFDFSKVEETKQLSGDLKVELVYTHNSSDSDPVSGLVTVTLDEKGTFALNRTADSLLVNAPQSTSFSRWDNKNLVLAVTAKDGTKFPADAKLTVKVGNRTYTYSKNTGDRFVIPITWSSSETVSMRLNSDLMSAKDESYTANVRLCVGDEVDSASSQPQAVDYETEAQVTDISLSVSETTEPSLKIVGTQKVLTNKETLNLTINSQNVDGVDGCTIHATIQQKGATGYSGNFLDANVSTGNNQFGLGGIKEAGSYRLLITVTKDNQELLAVPYYFIVQ